MQLDDPFAAPASVVADPSGSSGAVAPGVVETLRRTKGWVRFLAVLGFIGAGFSLLLAAFAGVGGLLGSGLFEQTEAPVAISLGYAAFVGLMALLYIVPCVRLMRFASGIDRLEQWRDAVRLEQALEHQRAFWRFLGIAAIVLLVVYAAIFAGVIVFGVASAVRGGA